MCSGISRIVIPDSVETIGDYAFCYIGGLSSITIGNGVTSIGTHAFSYCPNITYVFVGQSVKTIGEYAFYEAGRIETVLYNGDDAMWMSISIGANNSGLVNALRYYYSDDTPTDGGNYWHYVDGVPGIWEIRE